MKRIMTFELVPGMIIGENVLSIDKQLVIAKGSLVTDSVISKLDLYGIYMVFIDDSEASNDSVDIDSTPNSEDSPNKQPNSATDDDIPKQSYSEKIKNSETFKQFKADYELNVDNFKNEINNVVEKNIAIDVKTLLNNSLKMISRNNGQLGILDMLQNMREYDDSTFAHCMNVALICNIFAGWLKMGPEEVELTTTCGLLHDIGKLLVPQQIITKPGKLSDDEFHQIQKHPAAGYNLLKEQDIDSNISYAALMHHERNDGTGYPLGIDGSKINKYAKIVSIADVYDAMTACRVYRGPLCPFKVIEMFEKDSYQKYDVEYLMVFIENVVNSYINNTCLLSDGRKGEIIFINKEKHSRPIIKVGNEYVNLLEHTELSIEAIL